MPQLLTKNWFVCVCELSREQSWPQPFVRSAAVEAWGMNKVLHDLEPLLQA